MGNRPRADAVLRATALTALVAATVITGAAIARGVARPDVDHWADSFPIVAEVGRVIGPPTKIVPPSYPAEATHAIYDAEIGDLRVRRRCAQGWCDVSLERSGAPIEAADNHAALRVREEDSLVLRRDLRGGRHILMASSSSAGSSSGVGVFHVSDLALVEVGVSDVAATSSPPRGWIAGALAGLAIAFSLQVKRRRDARAIVELSSASSGTLTNGSIRLDDGGGTLRAPPGAAVEGRVAVVSSRRSEPYRDAEAVAVRLLAGDRRELLADLRARLAVCDATSLGLAVATVAPLLIASSRGLLF
jgi:hypothetical protein